jgi:hypothetical protein
LSGDVGFESARACVACRGFDKFARSVNVSAIEPGKVAAAAMHALFDSKPKVRYMVVPNQEEAQWTIDEVIKELIELNEGQPYSYSREQLIEKIDAAMAGSD